MTTAAYDFFCEFQTSGTLVGQVVCFDYPQTSLANSYSFQFSGDRGTGTSHVVTSTGALSSAYESDAIRTATKTGAMTGLNDGTKSSISAPPAFTTKDQTLSLVRSWMIYTADKQTLLASYIISGSNPIEGVNGWRIHGSNTHPYSGYPSWLDGTAVQAGFDTSTSKYYIIDMSAENGFIWEFSFDSVGSEISGCRYRYPVGSSSKGTCLQFWGN